jgi:hypothetical protein
MSERRTRKGLAGLGSARFQTLGGLAQTPFCGVCDLPKGLIFPFRPTSGKNLLSGSMPFYKRIHRVAQGCAYFALLCGSSSRYDTSQ